MKDFKPTGRFGRLFIFSKALYWAQIMQIHSSLAGFIVVRFPLTLEIAILCWRFQTAWAERTPRVLNIPLLFSKWKVSSGILNCRNRSCRSSYLEYLITFEARLFKFRKLLADVCRWFIWEFSGLSGPGLLWISIWIVRSNQNRRPGSMSTVLPCLLSFEIEYLIAKTVDSIRFNDGLKNRPGKFRVPNERIPHWYSIGGRGSYHFATWQWEAETME